MEKFDNDVLLRLPLKPGYVTILRATMRVVAGMISFNYDEIMQLRIAVSEVFYLAMKHVTSGEQTSEVNELTIHFLVRPDKIEVLIAGPKDFTSYLNREEGKENLALLRSLVDEVEFGAEEAGKSLVRVVKYRASMRGT